MIIILEGPDGGGKSTLAKQLSNQLHCDIVWSSKPRDFDWELKNLRKYAANFDTVFDRSWYSEMVYGQVWRPEPLIKPEHMYRLEEAVIQQGGGLIIYCTGNRDTMYARRERTHNDDQNTPERYQRICQLYDELFLRTAHRIPVTTYEYKNL